MSDMTESLLVVERLKALSIDVLQSIEIKGAELTVVYRDEHGEHCFTAKEEEKK